MYNIGLDIGGTKVIGALFDEQKNILKSVKKKTKAREGKEVIFGQISRVIEGLIEGIDKSEIKGIGAGVPGIIDAENGVVLFSPNIPWENYPLKEYIEKAFEIKTTLANDVNVGVLGEWKYGAGRGYKNIVGIFVGTGIGGGLVINGEIYDGKIGAAGEIGHITVDFDGPFCGCGARGCLESLASKTAMQKQIEAQIKRGRKTLLKDILGETVEVIKSEQLKEAYDKNDELAKEILEDSAKYIGVATASLINILNPEVIIFGGGIMESMGDIMMPIIKESAVRYTMPKLFEACEFKIAELGDNSGLYGGLTLAENGEK